MQPLFADPAQINNLPKEGLRVAEFHAANVLVELLRYTDADAEFARRVVGEHVGLNHNRPSI